MEIHRKLQRGRMVEGRKRTGTKYGQCQNAESVLLRMRAAGPTLRPVSSIALGDPPTRFDQLDDVDKLFGGHDGEGGDGQDPWDRTVHLVGSAIFTSSAFHGWELKS